MMNKLAYWLCSAMFLLSESHGKVPIYLHAAINKRFNFQMGIKKRSNVHPQSFICYKMFSLFISTSDISLKYT
jgi:hypothetical protein